MAKLICVDVNEDDDYYSGPHSIPRAWKSRDRLTPAPPKGWLIMLSIPQIPHGLFIGCWIVALWELEKEEKERAQILHRVVRNSNDSRTLVVDPILKNFATNLVKEINGIINGMCDCGGMDCLAGDYQFTAMQTLARRAWRRLSIPQRIARLQTIRIEYEEEIGVGHAVGDPAFLNDPEIGIGALEEITGAR